MGVLWRVSFTRGHLPRRLIEDSWVTNVYEIHQISLIFGSTKLSKFDIRVLRTHSIKSRSLNMWSGHPFWKPTFLFVLLKWHGFPLFWPLLLVLFKDYLNYAIWVPSWPGVQTRTILVRHVCACTLVCFGSMHLIMLRFFSCNLWVGTTKLGQPRRLDPLTWGP